MDVYSKGRLQSDAGWASSITIMYRKTDLRLYFFNCRRHRSAPIDEQSFIAIKDQNRARPFRKQNRQQSRKMVLSAPAQARVPPHPSHILPAAKPGLVPSPGTQLVIAS